MIRLLRISVLILALVLAVLVSVKVWNSVKPPSTSLKIHVSLLALGYSLFFGVAIQDAVRILFDQNAPDFRFLTVFRLVATIIASVGHLSGSLWTFTSGRLETLILPVMFTDTIVIFFAWIVTLRGLNRQKTIYRDFSIGVMTLITWYVATIK